MNRQNARSGEIEGGGEVEGRGRGLGWEGGVLLLWGPAPRATHNKSPGETETRGLMGSNIGPPLPPPHSPFLFRGLGPVRVELKDYHFSLKPSGQKMPGTS